MGQKTGIEWTEATWNPVRGCSRVSEGCRNCYAERVAARFSGPGQAYEGLARMTDAGPRWTGEVRLIKEHLEDPLRWKRPRRIFVNSMSDLFHEKVSLETMTDIFEVMAKCPQHIFQVLTKRPDLMMTYMHSHIGVGVAYRLGKQKEPGFWPLPNVWMGVSVEDQKTADERIPLLLRTEAAVRWLSVEPLLGPIDLGRAHPCGYYCDPDGDEFSHYDHDFWTPQINTAVKWVVVGGESGPNARPMHPRWARGLRDQCVAAGVAFFFKQHGEFIHEGQMYANPTGPELKVTNEAADEALMRGTRLEDRAYQWPDKSLSYRVGKKAAGRLLDGRTWDEFPEVPAQ